jgi:acyl dehydratase
MSAFAAGVEDTNPAYFDDSLDGGLIGHPGLAFTFQWNSRFMPDVQQDPIEAQRGVHAWVDIRYTRPFRQGDVISAQGQTIAVRQIGPGTLSVQRIRMTDSTGSEVAVMDSGSILRGVRTVEPDEEIAPLVPLPSPLGGGTVPKWTSQVSLAPYAAHVYTECADIWNPIHTERNVALAAGLPDIILHGSATITIALREVINRSLGGDPTGVARVAGQFRAMVIPGEHIEVRCLEERLGSDETEIFFDCLNASGEPAIKNGLVVARLRPSA